MDDKPVWIAKCVIKNNLPWNSSKKDSFSKFHEKYTLHDSYWIGIFHNVADDNSITLAIEWDADCLSQDVKSRLSNPEDWLYLFIRITGVKQVLNSGDKKLNHIPRGVQRSISGSRLELVDKGQLLV